MIKYFLFLLTIFISMTSIEFAQSVNISPKKVVYKRGSKAPDYKKTMEITFPKIAGPNGAKIESILSYEKAFKFSIREEIDSIYWLDSAHYKINYNNNSILDVTLIIDGSGVYPSFTQKYLVVNTKTGIRIKPNDVFINQAGLARLGRRAQLNEMRIKTPEIRREIPDFDPNMYFQNAKFTTDNLWAFTVGNQGITFHYDYGFPHVIRGFQPEGDYFFSWKDMKPYIKKTGIFSQFLK